MRIYTTDGVTVIDQDEVLLSKIEGKALTGVDVSDLRIDADTLSKQYLIAQSTPGPVINGNYEYHESQRYAVLKVAYLNMVKEAEEKAKESL
jgi:hypothetical protein